MDYNYVPVELSDGSIIMVGIYQNDEEQDVSSNSFDFSDAFNTSKAFIRDFIEPLRKLKLGKVSVELGLGFSIDSGKLMAILATSSVSSSINIKVEFESNDN